MDAADDRLLAGARHVTKPHSGGGTGKQHIGPSTRLAVVHNERGTQLYNQAGSLDAKICDATNRVFGPWPSADEVVAMGRAVLGFKPVVVAA